MAEIDVKPAVQALIFAVILFGLVFCVVDCSMGVTRYHETNVVEHHCVPAHTEESTYTDADGDTHETSTYYPEEWHLICEENGVDHTFDVSVKQFQYDAIQDNDAVTVKTRQGRWTGHQWLPRIEP